MSVSSLFRTGLALTVLGSAVVPSVRAQSSPTIPMVCLSEPLIDQKACAERQAAFYVYLTQMGFGKTIYTLPSDWVQLLQPYYPAINVAEWKFGVSERQPADNATTDCDRTWFNDVQFVADLQAGTVTNHRWLLHEIAHYDQCIRVGGRDDYAKMWWDDLDLVTLNALLGRGRIDQLHDDMPMEAEAEAMALEIRDAIWNCCIHPETGEIVEPIEVEPMRVVPSAPLEGQTVSVSVDAVGGAEPYVRRWEVTDPLGNEVSVPGEASVAFPLERSGAWRIRLELSQGQVVCDEPPSLAWMPCHVEERVVEVKPRLARVSSVELADPVLEPGQTTTALVRLADLMEGRDQTVALSTSNSLVQVPASTVVTGGGGLEGSATVDVTVPWEDETLLLGDRTVEVRAAVGTDPSRSASATLTVRGYQMVGFEAVPVRDRMGREVYRIKVQLDRRVRVPIRIQLQSSDPRSLSPPAAITVQAGRTEAMVEVAASTSLRTQKSVTVTARHPSPLAQARQASVLVKPR